MLVLICGFFFLCCFAASNSLSCNCNEKYTALYNANHEGYTSSACVDGTCTFDDQKVAQAIADCPEKLGLTPAECEDIEAPVCLLNLEFDLVEEELEQLDWNNVFEGCASRGKDSAANDRCFTRDVVHHLYHCVTDNCNTDYPAKCPRLSEDFPTIHLVKVTADPTVDK